MQSLFLFRLITITVLISSSAKLWAQPTSFLDPSSRDTTVNPANDFYQYANGTWIKNAKIPDEYSSWGSFTTLYDENLKKLRTLLQKVSQQQHPQGSLEQKAGDFYKSGMDTIAINSAAYAPLKPMLTRIDALKNYKELLQLIAKAYKQGDGDLLGFYVAPDEKKSSKNIAIFYQSGLTLPEKGYYTRGDSNAVLLRRKLVELASSYFKLTGTGAATAKRWGQNILQLESKIAVSHRTPVELRNPAANYNKLSVQQLQLLAPALNWKALLPGMGIQTDSIDIGQPSYFKALSTLLRSQPVAVWKQKLKFDYINSKAPYLSTAFRNAHFSFVKELTGQKLLPERWKEVVGWSDENLKDVVGQQYVKEYFPAEAKRRMDTLVSNLQAAFRTRIQGLNWMSDTTKQKALVKLGAFMKKIGYPDKWKSYEDVSISPTDLFANIESLGRHDYNELLGKIDKAVDRTEWGMTPSTVNAYYNPTFNEIVFPAGILQFPFFDLRADDAINYGAIGMAIGHEMTHGFDDQGRQYDAEGNMKDWWGASDADKFKNKIQAVVTQYNGFKVLDTLPVNGELTLGENLADLGGLAIAYDAFKMTKEGGSSDKIEGLTPDQRFFLSFAQVWQEIRRPELERTLINTNPHSPSKYRVLGPLSNFEPFYKAFDVKATNAMYRKDTDRAKVW